MPKNLWNKSDKLFHVSYAAIKPVEASFDEVDATYNEIAEIFG